MTLDDFLEEVTKHGAKLSNMYECEDGTWFVAVRIMKPEWIAFYGRDKDRQACLASALRQLRSGKSNWPVDVEEVKKRMNKAPAKKNLERIRVPLKRVRV